MPVLAHLVGQRVPRRPAPRRHERRAGGLGGRALYDPVSRASHPVYHERDLPDVAALDGWRGVPHISSSGTDGTWYESFDGDNGTGIFLRAWPGAPGHALGPLVTTVRLGTRKGTVYGGHGSWYVSWQVGSLTYALQYATDEGGANTLDQFTQLLTTLTWP